MANINKTIRFYQPNDPYYWEVDNLPLGDLLHNDIILEDRIKELENALDDVGGDTGGDTFISTGGISDLKAYSTNLSGDAEQIGKIFVKPGKFISRIQLPALRESGWRMMRDGTLNFNNTLYNYDSNGLDASTVQYDMVRFTQGVARTAVVSFKTKDDATDKSLAIESWDSNDYNGDDPPERLDLIYITGSKPMDCDGSVANTLYAQDNIAHPSIGVVKGSYFRTDVNSGSHFNGPRFTDSPADLTGRTTGMGTSQIPLNTTLSSYGTIPMPDDLVNQAWHRHHINDDSVPPGQTINVGPTMTTQNWAIEQVIRHVTFSLPVAYVRVPRGYVAGDPIPVENVIDIRPFFRSAELAYNERAAIAASINPNGNNPFLTQKHYYSNYWVDFDTRISDNTSQITQIWTVLSNHQEQLGAHSTDIALLKTIVSGDDPTVQVLGPHEARIQVLEGGTGGGGGGGTGGGSTTLKIPKTIMFDENKRVMGAFNLSPANVGQSSENNGAGRKYSLRVTFAGHVGIPTNIPGEDVVGVYLRWAASRHSDDPQIYLYTAHLPDATTSRITGMAGGWNDGSTHLTGNVNSFFSKTHNGIPGDAGISDDVVIYCYAWASYDSSHTNGSLFIDGYVYNQTITI